MSDIDSALNMVEIKLCGCDGELDHNDFPEIEYTFPDGSTELLPVLCLENEIYPEDLYYEFNPVLKTLESDEEWTMFACYAGQIAEIRPGLFFYSFGDIDEIGERNFYIQGDLETVVDMLLEEWGPDAPAWEVFFKSIGQNGYPEDYEPGTLVDVTFFLPNNDSETLTVGISYNMENKELLQILRSL